MILVSDPYRTKEEYIERYANAYCSGNTEAAAEHAIVKAVLEEKSKEGA